MSTFDATQLEMALTGFNQRERALFALACAERLYPLYVLQREKHDGELIAARTALDEMWQQLKTERSPRHVTYTDKAETYLRGEDAEWDALNPLCDNAIAAVVYACQCVATGDVEPAKWAAVQAYEAADYVAHTLGELEFGTSEREANILRSEVVQSELRHQHEDISTIGSEVAFVNAVEAVRSAAKVRGAQFAQRAKMLVESSS